MPFTGTALFPSQAVTTTFAGLYPGSTDYPGETDYTGDVIAPTATLYPGATSFAGQGNLPILDVYISFSNIATSPPVWTWVSPNDVRSFSISRTEGETGTATLTLDNRDRSFDPTFVSSPYYPNVRPMNRVWLREQFTGETNDMFVGYAESYDQQWPGGGWSDAIAVLTASDEFKILALAQLPLTNPPRSNYQDVVAFDNPASYWTMDESSDSHTQPPAIVLQDATAPTVGQDTFELGQLTGKAPSRKHAKKPVGRKAPVKHHKKSGPPKPLKHR